MQEEMCYSVRMTVHETVITASVLNSRELKLIHRAAEIAVASFSVSFKSKKLTNGEKFPFVEKYPSVLDLESTLSKTI